MKRIKNTHNKRRISYFLAAAAFLGVSLLSVVVVSKTEPISPVNLEFEPIPEYHRQTFEELPEEFVVEVQQGTIEPAYNHFTNDEADMLMKIAQAEAGYDDIDGKAAVIQVVLNRVQSSQFPDTIEGVIFQDKQFSPISDGRYYTAIPDETCLEALKNVDNDDYTWIEALYFENAESSWQSSNCEYLYTIGHHRFYK